MGRRDTIVVNCCNLECNNHNLDSRRPTRQNQNWLLDSDSAGDSFLPRTRTTTDVIIHTYPRHDNIKIYSKCTKYKYIVIWVHCREAICQWYSNRKYHTSWFHLFANLQFSLETVFFSPFIPRIDALFTYTAPCTHTTYYHVVNNSQADAKLSTFFTRL